MENVLMGTMCASDFAPARHPFGAGQGALRRAETGGTKEALPIWLAVLMATSCQAASSSDNHAVRWHHTSGRAVYTNAGDEDERIEPLGVRLTGGQTLAVSWMPGETEYTFEVYEQ